MSQLLEQENPSEIMISKLDQILEKQDLELKSKATILQQIAILREKIEAVKETLEKRVGKTQSDAAAARRERTWSN